MSVFNIFTGKESKKVQQMDSAVAQRTWDNTEYKHRNKNPRRPMTLALKTTSTPFLN
jgi:hypothetical protein